METEKEMKLIPVIQASLKHSSLFRTCGNMLQSSFMDAGQTGLELNL